MAYIGFTDIVQRGVYSRRGIEKMIKRGDFPAHSFTINRGRNKVWMLSDVVSFEATHPEFTSETAKRRKIAGYAAAVAKKRKKN